MKKAEFSTLIRTMPSLNMAKKKQPTFKLQKTDS
jgi:hypothetical protein